MHSYAKWKHGKIKFFLQQWFREGLEEEESTELRFGYRMERNGLEEIVLKNFNSLAGGGRERCEKKATFSSKPPPLVTTVRTVQHNTVHLNYSLLLLISKRLFSKNWLFGEQWGAAGGGTARKIYPYLRNCTKIRENFVAKGRVWAIKCVWGLGGAAAGWGFCQSWKRE